MRLVLQRGHVPRRTGSVGTAGEQQLVTRIASRVVELAPAGLEVTVIDADEPAARYRGDAFVALHADGSSNPKVGGASIGYRTPQGRELGEAWKDRYAANGWPGKFRGDNYTRALARYYGTGKAVKAGNSRAVIVEHGFLTNPSERAWMTSKAGIDAAARAAIEAATGATLDGTPVEEDDVEIVAHIQKALIDVGYDLGTFTPLDDRFPTGADGAWGSKTHAAFVDALKKVEQLGPVAHTHRATVKLD